MLYLTCTMISSVDLAHYGVFRAKDWVSVDCGTIISYSNYIILTVSLNSNMFTAGPRSAIGRAPDP